MITFCERLLDLFNSDKKQTISTFENANVYSLLRQGNRLEIVCFNEVENMVTNKYNYDYFEFVNAFKKALRRYLSAIYQEKPIARKDDSCMLLEERLGKLDTV